MTTLLRDTSGRIRRSVRETMLLGGTSVTLRDDLVRREQGYAIVVDTLKETAHVRDDGSVVNWVRRRNAGLLIGTDSLHQLSGEGITSAGLILRPTGIISRTVSALENRRKQIVYDPEPREELPVFQGELGPNGQVPSLRVSQGKERF